MPARVRHGRHHSLKKLRWGHYPALFRNQNKTFPFWSRSPGAEAYAAAALPIADVQCAHLRAAIGISLRHSGHFFVVGSAGAGSL